ncbi:MAG: DUF3572 domain-containing protein [Pseudomonadota bacterium]
MTLPMNKDAAQALALEALGWLAADPDRLGPFMAEAGCGPAELRDRAQAPEFLGFVVDHLLSDEARLMAFCDEAGRSYEAPMRARAALPGGDLPHWT